MSLGHGSSVVRNNLVFYYDMANSIRSWKGAPTTNLNINQSLNGMSGITLTLVGEENGWKKYSLNGTWNAGTYPFSINFSSTTLTGGVSYSARCLLKTNVRGKFATFGGLSYVNDPNMVSGGTSIVRTLSSQSDGLEIVESIRNNFIYSTGYANPTTNQLGYISSRPVANGISFDADTDFVWAKEIQVEQGEFVTPYVNGTRSNTEAILDLTGKNTITANSLTYDSSGSFSFNGTDNYIDTGIDFSWNNNNSASVSFWCMPTVETQRAGIIGKPSPDWEWAIQHGNGAAGSGSQLTFVYWNTSGGHSNGPIIQIQNFFQALMWVNVTLTWSATENLIKIYKNGQLQTNSVWTDASINQNRTNNVYIGGAIYTWNTGYWSGKISNVQLYNKELTTQEIQQNFEALRGRYSI